MSDLLCKFPSRSRPKLFAATFERWNAVPEDVRFVVSLDQDDPALPAYRDFLWGRPNVRVSVGESLNKVHAYNRDLEDEPFDIIVSASDDQVPQREDWAAEIRRLMAQHWPDGDGVLHLNDGRNGRVLNSICCMGRKYYDRFGYLYRGLPKVSGNDGYTSLWCDNELQEVSERLNRSAYIEDVIVKHEWVALTGHDELMKRNERFYEPDRLVFERRRKFGFPL